MIFKKEAKTEPPLLQAILEDDLEKVKKLAGNRSHEKEPNWLGFTPIEIAQFLDKEAALNILLPGRVKRKVKVKGHGRMDRKEFEDFFGVHYLSHLKFPNYPAFVNAVKRCSWIYTKTFLGKKMRWLAEVFDYELFAGHIANVEIRWIDHTMGYGLFAAEDFVPNTFIAEYTGEVTPLDLVHGPDNPYLLRYPRPLLSFIFLQVNAERMGNETRFINHSYRPNLKTGIALDRGLFRSFFVSRHYISKGSQLSFNYGRKYWQHQGKPLPL